MSVHLFPSSACALQSLASSSLDHGRWLSEGFKKFTQRSRICFPVRAGRIGGSDSALIVVTRAAHPEKSRSAIAALVMTRSSSSVYARPLGDLPLPPPPPPPSPNDRGLLSQAGRRSAFATVGSHRRPFFSRASSPSVRSDEKREWTNDGGNVARYAAAAGGGGSGLPPAAVGSRRRRFFPLASFLSVVRSDEKRAWSNDGGNDAAVPGGGGRFFALAGASTAGPSADGRPRVGRTGRGGERGAIAAADGGASGGWEASTTTGDDGAAGIVP